MSATGSDTATLEELLRRLEKAITQLANGTAPLDELVAAHQLAVSLLAEAQARLEAVKVRSEQLTRSLAE